MKLKLLTIEVDFRVVGVRKEDQTRNIHSGIGITSHGRRRKVLAHEDLAVIIPRMVERLLSMSFVRHKLVGEIIILKDGGSAVNEEIVGNSREGNVGAWIGVSINFNFIYVEIFATIEFDLREEESSGTKYFISFKYFYIIIIVLNIS